jgi:hypothetical protein
MCEQWVYYWMSRILPLINIYINQFPSRVKNSRFVCKKPGFRACKLGLELTSIRQTYGDRRRAYGASWFSISGRFSQIMPRTHLILRVDTRLLTVKRKIVTPFPFLAYCRQNSCPAKWPLDISSGTRTSGRESTLHHLERYEFNRRIYHTRSIR